MSKELKDMTKRELLEVIEKHGVPVTAANEKAPTNAELIASIEKFNNRFSTDEDIEEEQKSIEGPTGKSGVVQSSKVELQKADLLRKERVVVLDTQRFQALEEDVENMTIPVSFSNGVVEADRLVVINGEPQYLERGIIQRLEDVVVPEVTQAEEKKSAIRTTRRKRYNVMQVGGLTNEEIEAQRNRELARSGRK